VPSSTTGTKPSPSSSVTIWSGPALAIGGEFGARAGSGDSGGDGVSVGADVGVERGARVGRGLRLAVGSPVGVAMGSAVVYSVLVAVDRTDSVEIPVLFSCVPSADAAVTGPSHRKKATAPPPCS
jgi:hypothetical protein